MTLTLPERWPWGTLRIGSWLLPSFLALALAGLALATLVTTAAAVLLGRDPLQPLALAAIGAALFVAQGVWRRRSRGLERHAVLPSLLLLYTVWTILLLAAQQPLLPTLDLLSLGLAVQLGVGRLGCTLAGCCYGLPASWGLVAPADCGQPPAGVRRLPVALLEAAGWLLIAAGVALALADAPAGTGFGLLLLLYGMLRGALEPLRGDPVRRRWRGLRPAQLQAALCLGMGIAVLRQASRGVLVSGPGAMGAGVPWSALAPAGTDLARLALPPLGGLALLWLLGNRGLWGGGVRRLTPERRQGLEALARSLPGNPPGRQVRLHQLGDLRLGVSRHGVGPSRQWRISVTRAEPPLSRAEAEWTLETIATALAGPLAPAPLVVAGAAGLYLIVLPAPTGAGHGEPPTRPDDLQLPDYYLPLLPDPPLEPTGPSGGSMASAGRHPQGSPPP